MEIINARKSYRALWHWWLLVTAGPVFYLYGSDTPAANGIAGVPLLEYTALAITGMGLLAIAYERAAYRYTATERDVAARHPGAPPPFGVVVHNVKTVALQDVRMVNPRHGGLIGWLVGFGEITFATAGTSEGEVVWSGVARPMEIAALIRQAQRGEWPLATAQRRQEGGTPRPSPEPQEPDDEDVHSEQRDERDGETRDEPRPAPKPRPRPVSVYDAEDGHHE